MNSNERDERLKQIRERQEQNKSAVNDYEQPIPKYLTTAYSDIDFLLSLLDNQAATHGFAPMDRLDDVCGAYTPDGYCWRPKKHPIHGAVVGMGLHECDTPAQGFNAEREKKVADLAATRMRAACVDAIKSLRATPHGAAYSNAVNDAIHAIESLTLDQVEKKQ